MFITIQYNNFKSKIAQTFIEENGCNKKGLINGPNYRICIYVAFNKSSTFKDDFWGVFRI